MILHAPSPLHQDPARLARRFARIALVSKAVARDPQQLPGVRAAAHALKVLARRLAIMLSFPADQAARINASFDDHTLGRDAIETASRCGLALLSLIEQEGAR